MQMFPVAYVSYLVEFHATRDYFECHELLEEYWKEHPEDPLSDTWLGLIQLAVGQYHDRRGNQRGAVKMYTQASDRLQASPLQMLGLDKQSLLEQLNARISGLESEATMIYSDINFQITDEHLVQLCEQQCIERGLVWGITSQLNDDSLIHRHKLRDRSDVIAARQAAFLAKKKERDDLS